MNFHDYKLVGYDVSDFGTTITLHLQFLYPGLPIRQSDICFRGVVAYHFAHSGGAIVTDISETPIEQIIEKHWSFLKETAHKQGGFAFIGKSPQESMARLAIPALKAWEIESAIGLSGFIIAEQIL